MSDIHSPADVRSPSELAAPIRRSVMLSMALTQKPEGDRPLYTHHDYDEAMAALDELVRRAITPTFDVRLVAASTHDCAYNDPPPCAEEWPGEPWSWCGACLSRAVLDV